MTAVASQYRPYPAYKPSGVDWLGDVPEHWEVKALKYLSEGQPCYGCNIGAERYQSDGVRFLRTTDITDNGELLDGGVFLSDDAVRDHMLQDGDFIVSRSGTIGRGLAFDSGQHPKCSFAGYLVRFRMNDLALSRWVFWNTLSRHFSAWLKSVCVESTIGNVNGQKYATLPVALPTADERGKLLSFLDRETGRIDALVEKKRRLIELLEEKRTALISHAVTKGLNPNVPMKPSGVDWLGDVPEHWEVCPLKRFTRKIGSGVTPRGGAQSYVAEGVALLRSQNIHFSGLRLENVAYITPRVHQSMIGTAVLPSDVLINITGASIGRCALVPVEMSEANVNQHVCIVRPDKRLHPGFLHEYLCSFYGQSQVFSAQNGTSREGLNFEQLGAFLIPLPLLLPEQRAIADFLDRETGRIDALIDKNHEIIAMLQERRTALISAAVTGKIDVREEVRGT